LSIPGFPLKVAVEMNNELAERVRNVIAKHLRVPLEKVSIDSTFEDLGMDSLDGVNLLFAVEDEFEISIDDDEGRSISSVSQMVDGIEKLLARKTGDPAPSQHD
jgi:acyl carrier protein